MSNTDTDEFTFLYRFEMCWKPFFKKGLSLSSFKHRELKEKTKLNQTKTDFHRWQSLKDFQCHNVFFFLWPHWQTDSNYIEQPNITIDWNPWLLVGRINYIK